MPASPPVLCCRTFGADHTRALGGALAALARTGDVIVLVGDLGAGKTVLVQGFAAALGVSTPVTSPTFTLANRYRGRLVVNHLDVYRFDHLYEAHDLALPELLDDGVTLVEWGDKILPLLPPDHLAVTIRYGQLDTTKAAGAHPDEALPPGQIALAEGDDHRVDDFRVDDHRVIEMRCRGRSWRSRHARLRDALNLLGSRC